MFRDFKISVMSSAELAAITWQGILGDLEDFVFERQILSHARQGFLDDEIEHLLDGKGVKEEIRCLAGVIYNALYPQVDDSKLDMAKTAAERLFSNSLSADEIAQEVCKHKID